MSASANVPVKLEHQPIFDSLPYCLKGDGETEAFQSFPFLTGYTHISFEEQRLRDVTPFPSMATGDVGTLTPSALESFRAAYKSPPMSQDLDLLEPLLPLTLIRVTWENHTPTVFAIHRNILEHCSPFFKTILAPEPSSAGFSIEHGKKGSSEEEMAPTIEFEGSIVAFRLYAAWVYSGLIQKRILKIGVPGAENISYSNIGQAYILGDKLKDHKFKNAIVDCLLETIVSQGKMDLTLPNLIFDKTSASAPLKKLLVDIYVLYRHKDWLKPDGSSQTNSAIFLSGPFSCLPRSSRS